MATATQPVPETTFRSYTAAQAKDYNAHRPSYAPALYDAILAHHAATGGGFQLLVDVGCGPGNATRDLARSFQRAVGVDAGPAMIAAARELGGSAQAGTPIQFEVSPAEEFSHVEGLEAGSVDMVISATAVHWFEMDKFWAQAARALKPGGTVALWTRGSSYIHPATPNPKITAIMDEFRTEILDPYSMPGNRMSHNMYDDLPLPWAVTPAVPEFPQELFVRREWDRDGVLSNGKTFFGGGRATTVKRAMEMLSTASMVTRWREAHPELVGTKQDVVEQLGERVQAALGPGETTVTIGAGIVVLLFKKA